LTDDVVTGIVEVGPFCTWCANIGIVRARARVETAQVFCKTVQRMENLRTEIFGGEGNAK
jgi:hypothetical protein